MNNIIHLFHVPITYLMRHKKKEYYMCFFTRVPNNLVHKRDLIVCVENLK